MGNLLSNIKKPKPNKTYFANANTNQKRFVSDNLAISNLDEIVEDWIWNVWHLTRQRKQRKYSREDLLIEIDWKRVSFEQDETYFTNNTENEQDYSLKAERSTSVDLSVFFSKGFRREEEKYLQLKLPNDVVEAGGSIKHEQSIEMGKEQNYSSSVSWAVDSSIRVPPHSKTSAELVLTEENFSANFSFNIKIKGTISVTIRSRKDGKFVKWICGDISTIIEDAIKRGLKNFEIWKNEVMCTMTGTIKLRYGVEQNVVINRIHSRA
ncbi:hypothetical protein GJ496_000705 [Pomphorhynchus laevis]|nr:hypothetical protein GJ496_000705 [Pomphorhynchus laevis]